MSECFNMLFTDQSVAATSPEGLLPTMLETGNKTNLFSLVVWCGGNPKAENALLRNLLSTLSTASMLALTWLQHPAGEGLLESASMLQKWLIVLFICGTAFLLKMKTLTRCMMELLGRSMKEAIEPKLWDYGLDKNNVILLGFGKCWHRSVCVAFDAYPKTDGGHETFQSHSAFPFFFGRKDGCSQEWFIVRPYGMITIKPLQVLISSCSHKHAGRLPSCSALMK